jgi:hypothetical protein
MIDIQSQLSRLDISGGRTTLDKITESLLSEFSKEHGIEALDESKRFEHFASYIVVRGEHSESFETQEIVVGDGSKDQAGGGDTGLDGVAIVANGFLIADVEELEEIIEQAGYLDVTFVFIQAETSAGFEGAKIGTFGFGVIDFFRDQPKLKRNTKVRAAAETMQAIYEKSSKFRRGNPSCKLFYVTTGKWVGDGALEARIDSVRTDLNDTGQFRSVEFLPLGASDVQKRYQQSRHAISSEFTFGNRITVPDVPDVSEAYVGLLPWPEFKKLIIDDTGQLLKRLFFDNVRDFQGYNDVNSGIKLTLESAEKNRFVLMNNGVTVIARTVRATGNRFTVEDYQIVNGCQTSHVLYDQRHILDESVSIPIRLISTRNEGVIKAIIKATNRQTEISEEQLFALEEFPKSLELYFESYPLQHRLYFERRSRQYESFPIEKTRIVTFDSMIKSFAAMFLNEPHRTTRNFKSVKAKLGKEIFAKDQRMEPYYAAALALYKVEFLFRNKRLEYKYRPARFHILSAIRMLVSGYEMPALGANKMEAYCRKIIDVLQDSNTSEEYVSMACDVIDKAASGHGFDRDTIRTEPFTERVTALTRAAAAKIQAKAK